MIRLRFRRRNSVVSIVFIALSLFLMAGMMFILYKHGTQPIQGESDPHEILKNTDNPENMAVVIPVLNTDQDEMSGEVHTETSDNSVADNITEPPEVPTEPVGSENSGEYGEIVKFEETESESVPENATTAPPVVVTTEPKTAPQTEPPTLPTEPTEPPPPYDPANTVEGAYAPYMLENMIEITVGATDTEEGTSVIVEKPPYGRDLMTQAKITPIRYDNIPNPYEYFKDVIFLGDSVTTGFDLFRNHIKFNGEYVMADVTVVAAKSYSIFNATREISDKSVHPLFNGTQALPEDIIAEKEGNKIFICLGLNDVSWQSPNTYLQNYAALINRIRAKSPEKTVAILSITPLTFEGQKESLTNEKIMEFNELLIEFAAYNNIPFIDYAAAIRDVANNLYPNLSSDNYCHIVLEAYNRLTEYLIYHAID